MLIQLEAGIETFSKLITVMGRMDACCHGSLIEKDTRALLLFSYWLALMSKVKQWWIVGRARHECVAICRFSENDYDLRLRALLEFPVNTCEIDLATGGRIKPNFQRSWTNNVGG